MNTITSVRISLAAIAAALTLQLNATAQTAPDRAAASTANAAEHPFFAKIAAAMSQLGLDPNQREQIKTILKANLPAMKPLIQQTITEHRAMTDIIHAVPVNEDAIRTESAKVAALDTELAIRRAHLSADIQAVLHPDQIATLKKMESDSREKIDQHLSKAGNFLGAE